MDDREIARPSLDLQRRGRDYTFVTIPVYFAWSKWSQCCGRPRVAFEICLWYDVLRRVALAADSQLVQLKTERIAHMRNSTIAILAGVLALWIGVGLILPAIRNVQANGSMPLAAIVPCTLGVALALVGGSAVLLGIFKRRKAA